MNASSQKTAAAWGALVTGADAGFAGPWPRVQIWQGTSDTTVYPANAGELVKQWTFVNGATQTPSATDTISTATRTQYSAGGQVVVEEYLVTGMGHDVATGMDAIGTCPATSGAFFADEKICSTLRAAQFFGLLVDDEGGSGGSGSGGGDGDGSSSGGGGGGGASGGGSSGGGPSGAMSGCSSTGGGAAGPFALVMLAAFVRAKRPRTRTRETCTCT
jgi:MYXO-CTERM domain-containing protein